MRKTAGAAVPTTLELGIINSNLSLTTDSLKTPIPKGDYMINIMLTGSFTTNVTTHTHSGGDHSHSGGEHSHRLPAEYRTVKAGDRVLIAWCGSEPVIIAIVISS